jgi:Mn-containing catalase
MNKELATVKNKLENITAFSQNETRDINARVAMQKTRIENMESQGFKQDETKFLRDFIHQGLWSDAVSRIKQLEDNFTSLVEEKESENDQPTSEEQRDIVSSLQAEPANIKASKKSQSDSCSSDSPLEYTEKPDESAMQSRLTKHRSGSIAIDDSKQADNDSVE